MIGDRFEHICHLHNTENFRIPYWTHYVTETFRPLNYSNKDFQQHVMPSKIPPYLESDANITLDPKSIPILVNSKL